MKNLETLSIEKREKQKINEFIERLKKEFKGNILHIFLFGSFARNEYDENSDIDILIILKKKSLKDIIRIYEIATDVYLEFGGAVLSLKLFDEKYYKFLKEVGSGFIKDLEKDKVLL